MAIAGFIDVSASFGFEESTSTINGVEHHTDRGGCRRNYDLLRDRSGTSSETGFLLSNGQIGAVIDRVQGGETEVRAGRSRGQRRW
ncbi:MAG UNVERIFIED_CONTAM: hypothetical protein LVR18_48630 [Planctomycetaceae bacterium]